MERSLPVLDPAFTLARYIALLRRLEGFHRPFETRLRASADVADAIPDLAARMRAPALCADLAALGAGAERLDCSRLPETDSLAFVVGCLYVTEGSTLGGQIIARHLRATLGVTPERGGAFFRGYGERTAAMWKRFGAYLNEWAAAHPDADDAMVAGARACFLCYEAWLSEESRPAAVLSESR